MASRWVGCLLCIGTLTWATDDGGRADGVQQDLHLWKGRDARRWTWREVERDQVYGQSEQKWKIMLAVAVNISF